MSASTLAVTGAGVVDGVVAVDETSAGETSNGEIADSEFMLCEGVG